MLNFKADFTNFIEVILIKIKIHFEMQFTNIVEFGRAWYLVFGMVAL
jgi:hypothetical protein